MDSQPCQSVWLALWVATKSEEAHEPSQATAATIYKESGWLNSNHDVDCIEMQIDYSKDPTTTIVI